jgi:sulfatase maturation enzyme AslB (radical SAM superfamily)
LFIQHFEINNEIQVKKLFNDVAIIPVKGVVEPGSVTAKGWSDFLTTIFDGWLTHDFGSVFIPYFDNFLGVWMDLFRHIDPIIIDISKRNDKPLRGDKA